MGRRRLGAMESHTPPGGPQEVSGDHLSHEQEMMMVVMIIMFKMIMRMMMMGALKR